MLSALIEYWQQLDLSVLTWIGIIFCVSQSAMFSGLNLAFFSLSRLRLEVEAGHGNTAAKKVLQLREDSNFLLATILWGNVGINVLLTMMSDSVLAGVSAFLFSTIAITLFGEIGPQAYFSRNALAMASRLSGVIRFYQILFYPVAKVSGRVLDVWLGKEGISYLAEKDLKSMLRKHIDADEADVDHVEGIGALNFLIIDDLKVSQEGETLNPESIIALPCNIDLPVIPETKHIADDEFLQQVHASGHKWVVLTDPDGEPHLVLDADGFLRAALFDKKIIDPYHYCHRPLVIRDPSIPLGDVIFELKCAESLDKHHDAAIKHDVVLMWCEEKRIITGADLLGRLLKGIAHIPKDSDKAAN